MKIIIILIYHANNFFFFAIWDTLIQHRTMQTLIIKQSLDITPAPEKKQKPEWKASCEMFETLLWNSSILCCGSFCIICEWNWLQPDNHKVRWRECGCLSDSWLSKPHRAFPFCYKQKSFSWKSKDNGIRVEQEANRRTTIKALTTACSILRYNLV